MIITNNIKNVFFLKILNDKKNDIFALYLLDKNTKEIVFKYKYQKCPVFKINSCRDVNDFLFKIYIKNTQGVSVCIYSYEMKHYSLDIGKYLEYIMYEARSYEEIQSFIDVFISQDTFFQAFIRVKQGFFKVNIINLNKIIFYFERRYINDFNEMSITHENALKTYIYLSEIRVLNFSKHRVLYLCEKLSPQDCLFYKGVLFFRLGLIDRAKKENAQLIYYKHLLQVYQGGAISYIETAPLKDQFRKKTSEVIVLNKLLGATLDKGVMLVSADYGYFCAYSEKTINNSLKNNNLTHFHLILPNVDVLKNIDISIFENYNVGLSYEVYPLQNNKTYYSIARYLVLETILELYNSPIIVCDIDVDLSHNLNYLFKKIGNKYIALATSGNDLPWISYMAGFCYFGASENSVSFIRELALTLRALYFSGKDLWTLDQVALQLCVETMDNPDLILNVRAYLENTIKQYQERSKARTLASQSVANII